MILLCAENGLPEEILRQLPGLLMVREDAAQILNMLEKAEKDRIEVDVVILSPAFTKRLLIEYFKK